MRKFKDHFSNHAVDYSRYRPGYPAGLFAFLAAQAPDTQTAWDCGTGNGQAALTLADHFTLVHASDASAEQITQAVPHPRIHYSVAPAEHSGLPAAGIALITVAQALHWFDLDAFYREAQRVLKPNGVLAAWAYGMNRVNPAVDTVTHHLYADITAPCWPPERRHIDAMYADLPFPFPCLPTPAFTMAAAWTLDEYCGYLHTWSGVQRYQKVHGEDPLCLIEAELAAAWGEPHVRQTITWPLAVLLGRKEEERR